MRIVVGAVLLIAVMGALDCKNYLNYDQNTNHTKDGKCLVTDGDNRYATACTKSTTACDKTSGDCKTVTVEKKLAGQVCASNDSCGYGNCVGNDYNKKCEGKKEDAICSEHKECDVGLYCVKMTGADNKTCEKLKDTGSGCTSDESCQQNLACIGGNCNAWFSGGKDAECSFVGSYLESYECSSQYYCKKATDKTTGSCTAKPPKGTKTGACTQDSDCTTNTTDVTGTCACAISTTKAARCSAQPGDDAVQAAYAELRKYVAPFASVALNCQTTLRYSADCFQTNADPDVWLGYQIAKLSLQMAIDPDYGQQSADKFSQDPLEALKPHDAQYISDSTFQGHCDTYKATTALVNDTCVKYASHQYQVQACSTNDEKTNTCTTAVHSDARCGTRPKTTYPQDGLDGDYCEKSSECKSQVCKSKRCKGTEKKGACSGLDDFACAAGLACIENGKNSTDNSTIYQCLDQIAVNKACVVDVQCQNGLVCNGNVCTEEFSIPSGQDAKRACGGDDVDTICKTGQCVSKTSTTLTCVAGYKTAAEIPKKTTQKQDCEASTSTTGHTHNYQFGSIQCASADSKSGSYCSAKLGDQLGLDLIKQTLEVRGKSQGHCHYMKQLDPFCWHECSHHGHDLNWTTFTDYYELQERFANYPSLESGYADNATLQVFFPSYWGAKYNQHYFDYPGDSAGVLATLLALLLLLL